MGLSIMLYPVVINYINSNQAVEVITAYSSDISSNTSNKNEKMIDEARLYNSRISGSNIIDAFSNPEQSTSQEYLNILNVRDNGMMGYLQIPKIDVKIPIYHGTSDEVLQKGVGHVEGSSFPVGGDTTHAVLSAHSGLPSARLFTDLNQLQNGDMFYVYILDQVFAYKVDQVLVVEPSDIEALKLQEGEDYVTLVTCTPYAINTHRLLVRGTRVEYSPEVLESTPVAKKLGKDEKILYLSLALVFVILLLVLFFVLRDKKKYEKKRRERSVNTNNIVNNFNNQALDINQINSNLDIGTLNVGLGSSEALNTSQGVANTANVTPSVSQANVDTVSEINTNSVNSNFNNVTSVVDNTVSGVTKEPVIVSISSESLDNSYVPNDDYKQNTLVEGKTENDTNMNNIDDNIDVL